METPKKQRIIQLAGDGYNYSEIARKVGVTRQYVTQVLRNSGTKLSDFRRMSEGQCIYPNLRNWWNDNRMNYHRFFELMEISYHNTNIERLHDYFKGTLNPRKDFIDRMIKATGMPYETLFYKEGG